MSTLPENITTSLMALPPVLLGVPSGAPMNDSPIKLGPSVAFWFTLNVTFAIVPFPLQSVLPGFANLSHCVPGVVVRANWELSGIALTGALTPVITRTFES